MVLFMCTKTRNGIHTFWRTSISIGILMVFSGCDSDVKKTCPPPFEPKAAIITNTQEKTVIGEKPDRVFIYLDGSGSMNGYLAPGATDSSSAGLYPFARFRKAMSDLSDAASEPNTQISRFMAFEGNDIRAIDSSNRNSIDPDRKWRAITSSDCYKAEKGMADKNPFCKLYSPITEKNQPKLPERLAYSGDTLSNQAVFKHFREERSKFDEENPATTPRPRDVAVFVSDLFTFNNTAPGDASELIAPLQSLIDEGQSVALVSIWSGFDGKLFDLPRKTELALERDKTKEPGKKLIYQGLLPLHMLVVGDASAVRRLVDRLYDRLANGSNAIPETERNKLFFDSNIASAPITGDFIKPSGAKGEEKGWQVLAADKREKQSGSDKEPIWYLSLQHNPKYSLINAENANNKGIEIAWPKSTSATYVTVNIDAWKLLDNVPPINECSDTNSIAWEKLDPVQAKTDLGWSPFNKDDSKVGGTLLNGQPFLDHTYAVRVSLVPNKELNLSANMTGFMQDWVLPENDAPLKIKNVQQPTNKKTKPEERKLGTINLDQVVHRLALRARERSRAQADTEASLALRAQTIVIQPR